jgi:hypothetical protein
MKTPSQRVISSDLVNVRVLLVLNFRLFSTGTYAGRCSLRKLGG